KIRQFFPIRAPFIMVTLDPIQVPSPISTSRWIVENGSTTTFWAILASGCMYDNGCIMLITFYFYNLSHKLCFTYYLIAYHADPLHSGNSATNRFEQLTTENNGISRSHLIL